MATLIARISVALQAIGAEIKAIKTKLPVYATTAIADANYTILASDRVVVLASITASRKFTLPDITTFPLSTFLTVGDSSNSLSETVYLDIVPNELDSIAPYGGFARLSNPDAAILLVRGAGRKWIVVQ